VAGRGCPISKRSKTKKCLVARGKTELNGTSAKPPPFEDNSVEKKNSKKAFFNDLRKKLT